MKDIHRTGRTFLILVMVSLFVSADMVAKVKLSSILASNMVLQQQTQVKLWGNAKALRKVTITTSWNNKEYRTLSDTHGWWSVEVATPVAGGPYRITFNDGEVLALENILIGEVWFCSGQSNMEMPMRGFDRQPLKGTNDIIVRAKSPTPIRIFNSDSKEGRWLRQSSKTPQKDCQGEWQMNLPENVAEASATAYYFARYIQEVLEVPVGIVVSTLGGSKIEAWMSREAISAFSSIKTSILDNQELVKDACSTSTVLHNAKIAPFLTLLLKVFFGIKVKVTTMRLICIVN